MIEMKWFLGSSYKRSFTLQYSRVGSSCPWHTSATVRTCHYITPLNVVSVKSLRTANGARCLTLYACHLIGNYPSVPITISFLG